MTDLIVLNRERQSSVFNVRKMQQPIIQEKLLEAVHFRKSVDPTTESSQNLDFVRDTDKSRNT